MTEPLRLAVLGINYAPEEIGIGRYTTDMTEALAARGHTVEVIAAKPYYPQWSIHRDHRAAGWRRTAENGVKITRCPLYVPAQPTGLKRIVHLASFAVSALLPALGLALRARRAQPEVIMCIAPALLSVPVAWLAARLAGAKLWVHVQDFEVEAAFATGLVNSGGLAARLARALENRLLRLADRVSTISPQMCARLVDKGVLPERVIEIRNWADGKFAIDPEAGAAFRAEWGLREAKVALYSGNIANKQGIDLVIEAARLLAHRPDIAFVICGDGPNRARLEQLATGLANIHFHPLQPSGRVAELLCLASVHLLPQIPGAADLVLPSKLTNMLASGRPVVATAAPGTGLYDEVEGCGLLTAPGDAAALAAAVATLIDDPALAETLGAEGRRRAVERWSLGTIIARLENALVELTGAAERNERS